jgi:diapolycopene oxygenase
MGETYMFDAIVSNEDAVRTHRELLAGTEAAREFEHKRSMSRRAPAWCCISD